jgi:hypothetical protein
VAQLTSAYYANPGLLTGAPQPNWAQAPGTLVGLGLSGNLLTVRPAPSFTGSVLVQVIVSDGQASAMQSFNVAVGSTNAANRARSVPASWQARSVPSLAARGLDRTAAAVAARAVDAVFAAMVSQG